MPCRDEVGAIETCVRSILAQEGVPGGFEIIVADGASDDGTRQVLDRLAAQDPRLRVITNPQHIVSTGLNAAIRAAKGDIIVRLDVHTEYAPDYISRCLEVLPKTQADNVGGPWVAQGDGLVSGAIAAAFQSAVAFGGARSHDPTYEGPVDTVYLGCWRRSAFERFGFFDEELVRNQDDEHNLRILRNGGTIWQSPLIHSWYRPRSSFRSLFVQYLQYGYWKVRVIQKHKLPASWRHLVPGAFVLTALLLLLIFCVRLVLGAERFPFLRALLWLLGSYAFFVMLASLHTAWRSRWRLLPLLPIVFGCFHFGYSLGFLRGLWDFVIRRWLPSQLTRLTLYQHGRNKVASHENRVA